MKHEKYNNKKSIFNGIKFDSKKEMARYVELLALEKSGEISNLERQKKFPLIPAQRDINEGKQGKVIERKCDYIADFVYLDNSGKLVVEDTKGFRTPEYIIKRKLMLFIHGIRIKEV